MEPTKNAARGALSQLANQSRISEPVQSESGAVCRSHLLLVITQPQQQGDLDGRTWGRRGTPIVFVGWKPSMPPDRCTAYCLVAGLAMSAEGWTERREDTTVRQERPERLSLKKHSENGQYLGDRSWLRDPE